MNDIDYTKEFLIGVCKLTGKPFTFEGIVESLELLLDLANAVEKTLTEHGYNWNELVEVYRSHYEEI